MAEYAGLTELVWLTNDARAENIHREYLLEILFAQVAISERSMSPASREPVSGAIVVFSTDAAVVDPALIDFFKAHPDNIYVALSNESLNYDTACYAALRTVIRPYFDPRIGQENTCFIPNGSVNGYHNPELEFDFAQRDLTWTFAGAIKADRAEMIGQLAVIDRHFIHLTSGWMTRDGLRPDEVTTIYRRTVFVPCPTGNIHPDSLRIMEALEWGCIPVTVRFKGFDYFRSVFGDHPFVVARDWGDARSQMRKLLEDPVALRQRQVLVAQWYRTFRSDLARDMADLVEGRKRVAELTSAQFRSQRQSRARRIERIVYELHFSNRALPRQYRLLIRRLKALIARYG